MKYRSALLGCGPRAAGHAGAYAHVTSSELAAICDLDEQRLNAFGDRFNIDTRYTDLHTMLEYEQPDLVHCVTDPTLRVPLMTQLAEADVPAVLVEKPVCIGAEDYKALRELNETYMTKFAVNHQLRHHPRIRQFLSEVRGGGIGQVRCIDASSALPMAGQGVHVLDLMFAFNDYAQPRTVFGACSGYDDINGTHPSPATAEFMITFENGTRALLHAGEGAPRFFDGPTHMHKRIAVYGTNGFRHWWMSGYETVLPDGSIEKSGQTYGRQDVLGQAALTEAVLAWIEDNANVAPTNLSTSLDEWLVILGGYMSSIESRPVQWPFDPPDDLLDQFKRHVGAE